MSDFLAQIGDRCFPSVTKHVVFQGHILWVSILEAFSCLAYVPLCKCILFKIKSFLFDYDFLLSALKASVLLP